jgi:hypothetical protein
MNFVNSTYLFALLGFLIPIAIHLWNKKEAKVIKVGSIQFVPTQDSNQSKSIQLNEVFLLLLRCLILGIISFLMVGLIIKENKVSKNIALVDPRVLQDDRVQTALDSMMDRYEIRLMIDNLPVYDPEEEVEQASQKLWALANDINKLNSDSIIIFSNQTLVDTKGKRPEINKVVNIISIDPLETKRYLAAAYQLADRFVLFYGSSNGFSTTYIKQVVAELPDKVVIDDNEVKLKDQLTGIPLKRLDTLEVAMVYEDEFLKDKTILDAQIRGIAEYTGFPIKVTAQKGKELTSEFDWLIWLTEAEIPDAQAKSISIKKDEFKPLLYEGIDDRSYHLNSRLNYDNVLANDLSNKLLELFYELPVDANDQRIISSSQLNPVKNVNIETLQAQIKAGNQYWLWVLLFLVLVFERFVSMIKTL